MIWSRNALIAFHYLHAANHFWFKCSCPEAILFLYLLVQSSRISENHLNGPLRKIQAIFANGNQVQNCREYKIIFCTIGLHRPIDDDSIDFSTKKVYGKNCSFLIGLFSTCNSLPCLWTSVRVGTDWLVKANTAKQSPLGFCIAII